MTCIMARERTNCCSTSAMAALRRIHRERSISPNASGKTALFMERTLRPVNLTSQNSASRFPPRHDSFLIQGRVTRTTRVVTITPGSSIPAKLVELYVRCGRAGQFEVHTIPGANAVRYLETKLARGNG